MTWQMEKFNEGGGDQCMLGLNFETLRPRRDVLVDYKSVIDRIYTPEAFFGRVTRAAWKLDCFWPSMKQAAKPRGRVAALPAATGSSCIVSLGWSSGGAASAARPLSQDALRLRPR